MMRKNILKEKVPVKDKMKKMKKMKKKKRKEEGDVPE